MARSMAKTIWLLWDGNCGILGDRYAVCRGLVKPVTRRKIFWLVVGTHRDQDKAEEHAAELPLEDGRSWFDLHSSRVRVVHDPEKLLETVEARIAEHNRTVHQE